MIEPWARRVVGGADSDLAVQGHGARRTHRELRVHASRFAHRLVASGFGEGDGIVLLAEDRAEAIEAYLGVGLSGATVLHVNDRLAAPEIVELLTPVRPRLVVHTTGLTAVAAHVAGELGALPTLAVGDVGSWREIVEDGPDEPPAVLVSPDAVAVTAFTSGTTGRPKGVPFSQATLGANIDLGAVNLRLGWRDSCAFIGTFSFPGAVYCVAFSHLRVGGAVHLLSGSTTAAWIDAIRDERAATTIVPSPLVPGFVAEARRRPADLRSLVAVLHSGSGLPRVELAELVAVLDGRLVEAYGMTETGLPLTHTTPRDWLDPRAEDVYAAAGRPLPFVRLRICDPHGRELPAGEVGEIRVRTPAIFGGYLVDGAPSPGPYGDDGWFRTGDAGRLDAAGFLYLTGRLKEMIVSGGMNVFPAEVERCLAELPGVADVAVVGIPHPRWGETVAAAVVPEPGAALDTATVLAHARERLAGYKKPTVIDFVDELPRNANAKVLKHRVRADLLARRLADG